MFSFRANLVQIKKALIVCSLILPLPGFASTLVEMHTSLGDIEIQLYDQLTPKTVANFLAYVDSGAYNNSFMHRSVPGFIVQGGGFTWNDAVHKYTDITTTAPVVNEFSASNLRGTIAMAKLGGNPDSATNQWFFNLANNSVDLDKQNGGFTVFGQVIGNGMQVVDRIAALAIVNAGGDFGNLPLRSATGGYNAQNLVMVNKVETIPVPAAVWLFASGLGLIRFAPRRKKSSS